MADFFWFIMTVFTCVFLFACLFCLFFPYWSQRVGKKSKLSSFNIHQVTQLTTFCFYCRSSLPRQAFVFWSLAPCSLSTAHPYPPPKGSVGLFCDRSSCTPFYPASDHLSSRVPFAWNAFLSLFSKSFKIPLYVEISFSSPSWCFPEFQDL